MLRFVIVKYIKLSNLFNLKLENLIKNSNSDLIKIIFIFFKLINHIIKNPITIIQLIFIFEVNKNWYYESITARNSDFIYGRSPYANDTFSIFFFNYFNIQTPNYLKFLNLIFSNCDFLMTTLYILLIYLIYQSKYKVGDEALIDLYYNHIIIKIFKSLFIFLNDNSYSYKFIKFFKFLINLYFNSLYITFYYIKLKGLINFKYNNNLKYINIWKPLVKKESYFGFFKKFKQND